MTVQRGDANAAVAQRANDRIHLGADHDEVAVDRGFPTAGRLEVDRGGKSHRRRDLVPLFGDLLDARDADLIDAAVDASAVAECLRDGGGVEIERGSWPCCSGVERRL